MCRNKFDQDRHHGVDAVQKSQRYDRRKANVPGTGEASATEVNANTSARTVEMNFIVSYSVEEVLGAEGGGKEWWERSAHRDWRPRAYIDCVI